MELNSKIMMKVKFKIRHDDALFFGRYSYLEVLNPSIETTERHTIVKGPNGEIVAVLNLYDSLIMVSAEPFNDGTK